jgi:hypothetical protein
MRGALLPLLLHRGTRLQRARAAGTASSAMRLGVRRRAHLPAPVSLFSKSVFNDCMRCTDFTAFVRLFLAEFCWGFVYSQSINLSINSYSAIASLEVFGPSRSCDAHMTKRESLSKGKPSA